MTITYGTPGNDTLVSLNDGSTVYGFNGDDNIFNASDNSELRGNGGNDTIVSIGSNNLLHGGSDDDILFVTYDEDEFDPAYTANTLDGGSGNDTIAGDIFVSDSLFIGGSGEDIISIDGDNSTLRGGDDSDFLSSFGYDNFLYGNSGNDVIFAVTLGTELSGGSGEDTIIAIGSENLLTGGSGNDVLLVTFDEYSEFIPYNRFNTIQGGSGHDIIYGDFFTTDSLFEGNSGNDILVLEEGIGNTVEGGTGEDFLVALTQGGEFYGENDNDLLIRLPSIPGDDVPTPFSSNLYYAIDGDPGLLSGGSGNDILLSFGAYDNVQGDAGDDLLIGVDGYGTLGGGTGTDIVVSLGGSYELSGGSGNDVLLDIGNYDGSRLGGNDNDVIISLFGDGTASGGQGDDVLVAALGQYSYNGNSGNDILLGLDMWDSTLEGSSGDDVLLDGIGGNTLSGGTGSDILVAGLGNGLFDTYETLFDEGSIFEAVGDKAVSLFNDVVNVYQPQLAGYVTTFENQFDNLFDLTDNAYLNSEYTFDLPLAIQEGAGEFLDGFGLGLYFGMDALSSLDLDTIVGEIGDNIETIFDEIDIPESGDSLLMGGTGNDTFVFLGNDGNDIIEHFEGAGSAEGDLIAITHTVYETAADVLAATSYVGNDALIDMGIGHSILVEDVGPGALTVDDFIII